MVVKIFMRFNPPSEMLFLIYRCKDWETRYCTSCLCCGQAHNNAFMLVLQKDKRFLTDVEDLTVIAAADHIII